MKAVGLVVKGVPFRTQDSTGELKIKVDGHRLRSFISLVNVRLHFYICLNIVLFYSKDVFVSLLKLLWVMSFVALIRFGLKERIVLGEAKVKIFFEKGISIA